VGETLSVHAQESAARPSGQPIDVAQLLIDAGCWVLALAVAQLLRLDLDLGAVAWVPYSVVVAALVAAQAAFGVSRGLYRNRLRGGSFEEVGSLSLATASAGLLVGVSTLLLGPYVGFPRSVVALALPFSLLLMLSARFVLRARREAVSRPSDADRVIVYGAGFVGESVVRRMLLDPESPYLPVALIDDDPALRRFRLRDIEVMGDLAMLPAVVARTGATALVVAIAGADAALIRRAVSAAEDLGLSTKVVPTLREMLDQPQPIGTLRDLSIEDIVGRQPVDTDVASIAGYLAGRRVLVTGAGGSIGQELCRQIHRFGPAELIMLDRDETGLQTAQLAVFGNGLLDGPEVVLADIRDAEALAHIFTQRRPEVVFHAAALKHLPMLQQYPDEAWKTNVIGTWNVLAAARAVGVKVFVNISTDKAANPTSVLGASKRLAERLTARAGQVTGDRYLSVRFGNVLGSRGSMVPLFQKMIAEGGPITVTDPEATRFFMTIPEACELVVQAGGIGQAGEVMILDMGEPVKILDVAHRMISMSGRDVEIVYTGLRDGEKLHEVLAADAEDYSRTAHERIFHVEAQPVRLEDLDPVQYLGNWRRRDFSELDERDVVGSRVAS